MNIILDYFSLVTNKIIEILNSLKFNGSPSLLMFILVAIILGFILKLVKGSFNEFESAFNFSTGLTFQNAAVKYGNSNRIRKQQLISEKRNNIVYEYMDDNF